MTFLIENAYADAAPAAAAPSAISNILMLVIFIFIFYYIAIRPYLKQRKMFKKMTYDWYTLEYPENFKDNKISCYSCGNNRVHVRAIMNRTFHREHFCTQCGKTLYYSPEQS